MAEEAVAREAETADGEVKKEGVIDGSSLGKRPLSPGGQEVGKQGSSGNDSEATDNSTDDEASPNAAKTGVRRKRAKLSKESPGGGAAETADGEEPLPNAGKHRRKRSQTSNKSAEKGESRDGLLRLAQIANASPRLPKKQRGDKEHDAGEEVAGEEQAVPAQPPMDAPQPMAEPQAEPGMAQNGGEAAQDVQAMEDFEQKITPAQLRAWLASGQPLNLPGFLPHLLPHVQMGARWQLDLRTGERLEEQAPPQINPLAMHGQHPMMGGNLMQGSALAHALGARPPIFTGPNQQVPGSYGGVTPPNYSGALPIPALGVMGPDAGSPAGPYTALLGSQMQMQSLMPSGVMHGQYHQAFGPGSELDLAQQQMQQQQQAPPEGKKRRSGAANSNASGDGQEIPLRRRGRPAGDGSTPLASPKELQDRRMQANRAAASRSHFRRKREMEVLEKDCQVVEMRVIELRMALQGLLAQEEQLRMQQGAIREHLAAGCNPDQPLPLLTGQPGVAPGAGGMLPPPAQGEHAGQAEHPHIGGEHPQHMGGDPSGGDPTAHDPGLQHAHEGHAQAAHMQGEEVHAGQVAEG